MNHEPSPALGGVLHLSRVFDKSTFFMQNKPNFRKAQMNVNSLITKDYRKNDAFAVQKNKPNSKPKQTQFGEAVSFAERIGFFPMEETCGGPIDEIERIADDSACKDDFVLERI